MRSATHSPHTQHRGSPDPTGPVVPGAPVEVWCRSLGSWSSGFVAVDLGAGGWQVLRRSDRSPLPVRFPVDDIRPVPDTHQLH